MYIELFTGRHTRIVKFTSLVLFVVLSESPTICGHIAGRDDAQTVLAASPRTVGHRIIVLRSYGYGREGPERYNSKFFAILIAAGMSSAEDVMLEYLDLNRNQDAEFRSRKRELLLHQYADRKIALIVAVEQPALNFLLTELKDLAPGVPVMAINATLPAGDSHQPLHRLQ
jgi:two-component system, sensor histidine kinase and response regulator